MANMERQGEDLRQNQCGSDWKFIEKWCGRVDSNHHGIATASPSSWCVCQFRHDRAESILSAEELICQTAQNEPLLRRRYFLGGALGAGGWL
jgi:hypothetical protein